MLVIIVTKELNVGTSLEKILSHEQALVGPLDSGEAFIQLKDRGFAQTDKQVWVKREGAYDYSARVQRCVEKIPLNL